MMSEPLEAPLAKARVSRKRANQNFERKADCMGGGAVISWKTGWLFGG
jgi:hypothetical protein